MLILNNTSMNSAGRHLLLRFCCCYLHIVFFFMALETMKQELMIRKQLLRTKSPYKSYTDESKYLEKKDKREACKMEP